MRIWRRKSLTFFFFAAITIFVLNLLRLSRDVANRGQVNREEHKVQHHNLTMTTNPCILPISKEEIAEKVDWHDYDLIRRERERTGPGEHGIGITLTPKEESDKKVVELYKRHGYHATISDRIARDRAMPDFRTARCHHLKYRRDLPTVSIIIPYFEEHLSALVRTFVTAYMRAPPHLIKEIILADDFSKDPSLHAPLDKIVAQYPKVRVLRMQQRMGAIRVRQAAAREATGEVLFFLDAHCEAGVNWLPPLLEPIMDNYRLVTCPFIDQIHWVTLEHERFDEGARGVFSWYMNYRRIPVPNRGPHNQEVPLPFKNVFLFRH